MAAYCELDKVAIVGGKIITTEGKIDHAGIALGLYNGLPGPIVYNCNSTRLETFYYANHVRNCTAVSGRIMLTDRQVFIEVEGFDESFDGEYSSIDYCLRVSKKGLRCVYNPSVTFISQTTYNWEDIAVFTKARFKSHYKSKHDPYLNINFFLDNKSYPIKPRVARTLRDHPILTLLFSHNMNYEGASYSQFELTTGLKQKNIISPIVITTKDGPLVKLYKSKQIDVVIIPHPLATTFSQKSYLKAIKRLASTIKSFNPSLIYANTLNTFFAVAASYEANIPVIWNIRESEPWQSYYNNYGPKIAQLAVDCFQYPYRIIFVAQATQKIFSMLNQKYNQIVIPNGLNLSRFSAQPDTVNKNRIENKKFITKNLVISILSVGSICEGKGQEDLIKAITLLKPENLKKINVILVGDNQSVYASKLKKYIALMPNSTRKKIQFIEKTNEVLPFYIQADIFICTSRVESYPRVILEAMAFGLAIISTPVNGIVEQVKPHINAEYYEPGDYRMLAKKIEYLVENPSIRYQYAKASYQVFNTLPNFEDMLESYSSIFQEAANNEGNKGV